MTKIELYNKIINILEAGQKNEEKFSETVWERIKSDIIKYKELGEY